MAPRSHTQTQGLARAPERFGPQRVLEAIDPSFCIGSNMEKATAYAISAFIVGFGLWILIAGLSSSAPALWICAALIPIAIGFLSVFGHLIDSAAPIDCSKVAREFTIASGSFPELFASRLSWGVFFEWSEKARL